MQLALLPSDPSSAVPLPGPEEQEGRQRAELWVDGGLSVGAVPSPAQPRAKSEEEPQGAVSRAMLISSIVLRGFQQRSPCGYWSTFSLRNLKSCPSEQKSLAVPRAEGPGSGTCRVF